MTPSPNTEQRGFTLVEMAVVLMIIGLLAYAIDRLLLWFQIHLFPYLQRAE